MAQLQLDTIITHALCFLNCFLVSTKPENLANDKPGRYWTVIQCWKDEHVSVQRFHKQNITWLRGVSKEVILLHFRLCVEHFFVRKFLFASEKCGGQGLTQKRSLMMGMMMIGKRIQILWWVSAPRSCTISNHSVECWLQKWFQISSIHSIRIVQWLLMVFWLTTQTP